MDTQQQHIRKVISACGEAICGHALDISITYNSRDPFECIAKMSDQEWTAWTRQPGAIRKVYHKLMTTPQNRTARGLIQLQFEINADQQLETAAETIEAAQ